MRDLCGAPAYTYIFDEGQAPDNLWEKIIEGENSQYAMSAGTPGVDEGQYDDKGIVPGHAYSLLAARSIIDQYGDEVNLVQMRNPWKEGEWTGRFSDNSDEWTPELREMLNHYPSDDGIFWMTFEDMTKTFDQVDICKVDDKAKFSFEVIEESPAEYAFVKFIVPSHCNRLTTFAVTQRGCRTEEAEGNYSFDLNSYTRKVDVGFIKVDDESKDWSEKINGF